jgi:putative toxin-antitoxin system, antitoxin component
MEFMCKSQIIESLLKKILQTVERILANSETITSPSFYLLTPSGMERLESTCMLLIAIGEGVKGVDKLTDKKLLSFYPEMDWKGVMGMRDIIAHHYFDLDAEIVYDVIKHDLPKLKDVLQQIVDDLKVSNQAID